MQSVELQLLATNVANWFSFSESINLQICS